MRIRAGILGAVLVLGACSDTGTELTAGPQGAQSSTSTTIEPATSVPTISVVVETTTAPAPKPTKPPSPPVTETTPPPTEPLRPANPTDFTLALDGTTTDCVVVESPCWNIKASWHGAQWWFNVTPTDLVPTPGEPRLTTLPLGPAFYPQDENGKYYLSFRMRAGVSGCAWVRALRPVEAGGTMSDVDRSEAVQACIDTPAITG